MKSSGEPDRIRKQADSVQRAASALESEVNCVKYDVVDTRFLFSPPWRWKVRMEPRRWNSKSSEVYRPPLVQQRETGGMICRCEVGWSETDKIRYWRTTAFIDILIRLRDNPNLRGSHARKQEMKKGEKVNED